MESILIIIISINSLLLLYEKVREREMNEGINERMIENVSERERERGVSAYLAYFFTRSISESAV
jgi:hypothetical protein